jgi:hypothetical protein
MDRKFITGIDADFNKNTHETDLITILRDEIKVNLDKKMSIAIEEQVEEFRRTLEREKNSAIGDIINSIDILVNKSGYNMSGEMDVNIRVRPRRGNY